MILHLGQAVLMVRLLLAVALLGVAQAAQAQIGLPGVRLPRLPDVTGPGVQNELTRAADNIDSQAAANVRRVRIRDLLRAQRNVLEADPRGDPIMRGEVLALAPSDAALTRARAAGYRVIRERVLDGLDSRIVVLQAPAGISTRRALRQLRSLDPAGSYDFNHLYFDSGTVSPAGLTVQAHTEPSERAVAAPAHRVGLIDGGVDAQHPVFHDITIHQHGCGGASMPSEHGTAVASLLVGSAEQFRGAAPGAELFAADVYCGQPTGAAVDAVADAFSWLVGEHVPVINVSLVGPPNALLEAVVLRVIARGHVIVAAVGNDGPAAPPLYPAAYRDVIGVTAVDAHRRVLVEAERGPQVKFAAPGADMAAACLAGKFSAVRGTSFAAPIVAGLLSLQIPAPDTSAAQRAVQALIHSAIDLGARGPDKVYGNGLVGDEVRPDLSLVTRSAHPDLAKH
jgi:subtilisin family serine protease